MNASLRSARAKLFADRTVIAIVGPTASGKTALGIRLAQELDGAIISADSRQVYRYLDIGTAKPSLEEREGVPHYFLDILDPDEEYNAGLFGEQARQTINELFARDLLPIVVGGSGLYVKSLIDGFFEGPGADAEFRMIMDDRLKKGELPAMLEELRRIDPVTASRIDPSKPRRIIRALEVYHSTGVPLSTFQDLRRPVIAFTAIQFGLLVERKELYARIERRVERMIDSGLIGEISRLNGMGYDRRLNALNTVGYAEGFSFLAGEIGSDEMVRLMKRNTRRYAKRQVTWFSADQRVRWLQGEGERIVTSLLEHLENA